MQEIYSLLLTHCHALLAAAEQQTKTQCKKIYANPSHNTI